MKANDTAASAYGARFWEACDRGELLVQHCGHCDRRIFPPEPACPGCLSQELEWTPSPPTGTVYSFSIVHRSPGPAYPVPYALAVIDMDGGWSLISNIIADDETGPPFAAVRSFESVRSGARVRAEFTDKPEGQGRMPVFRLIPTGACA
jgi:uncharacterized OB-fold protein